MTEFEATVTGYRQVGAQYTILKCANVQMILIQYINSTAIQIFCNEEMINMKTEKMPLSEIVTMLMEIGWEVCA